MPINTKRTIRFSQSRARMRTYFLQEEPDTKGDDSTSTMIEIPRDRRFW